MCGIAGGVGASGLPDFDLSAALETIKHRGPDGTRSWADDHCVLGHQRLAIIDLSPAADQPLSNEDGTVWLTFNGEIYNFRSLRSQLERLGHRFRSNTDSEVIVHAYEQWGTACLDRFRGMFAIALWDQRANRLFIARDRVGKKPLFYLNDGARFLFASELQALLSDPRLERKVDYASIDAYLSLGYVPAPWTGFVGISKLPPAHFMTVDLTGAGFRINVEQYWSLSYEPKTDISEDEAAETLRSLAREAVESRLISDVPLGAFLSGGIDSSVVVGLMAQASSNPVKTFSIGFNERAFSELDHARRISQKWGTDHHEMVVTPDAASVIPLLVRHYGEPFADSSAIPTYYVAQVTRADVTVALNGDGGDESFGGYERYLANDVAARINKVPGSRSVSAAISRLLPDSTDPKRASRRIKRFLDAAGDPMKDRYARWVGYFDPVAKRSLYADDARATLKQNGRGDLIERLIASADAATPVDQAMAVDVRSYLPYDLLVKVDIATMAHSLEGRSPLLDHELMEFAARLPTRFKVRGRTTKYLMRKAFADLLPRENVQRPKMGFGVPVGDWFRNELRELLTDSLTSPGSAILDYLDAGSVRDMVNGHVSGARDHTPQLWSLLMLEQWHRNMVRRSAPVSPA